MAEQYFIADQGQHSRRYAGMPFASCVTKGRDYVESPKGLRPQVTAYMRPHAKCGRLLHGGNLFYWREAPTCQRGCRAFQSRYCGQDTKAARETGALQEFYATLAADPARAFYGPGHVRAAAELGAVGTLLLSDSLLRVNDVQQARLLTLALWAARCQRRA